jgi:peptidoglycan-N-acetylglucosamine deacetylase
MLTFKNTNLVFGLLLLALVGWNINHSVGWWVYLLLIFSYSVILFYGSAFVSSDFYLKVISSGPRNTKKIAITFDDGPAENFTEGVLDILQREKVPATFFCIGKNIEGKEAVLRRILKDGHIIGNHSFSHHFWFDMYGATKLKADIEQMNEAVVSAVGLNPRLFRPPYGVTTPNLATAVNELELVAVGWSIRSLDTVVKNERKLLDRILKAVRPGAILLLHDTSEATFLMLPAFIQGVRKKGYEIVGLDKLLNIAPYA